jgi:hypothetical protein
MGFQVSAEAAQENRFIKNEMPLVLSVCQNALSSLAQIGQILALLRRLFCSANTAPLIDDAYRFFLEM